VYLLNDKTKASDFIELGLEEREEFFHLGLKIKTALHDLFAPDKMNYAALSNVFPKLHVHFIPRYKTKRVFEGLEFVDTRWGKNYAPYDKSFQISFDIMEKLMYKIRERV
jgi:diadenosine tetraphosphate (Ap4A) HIT family hydrolase